MWSVSLTDDLGNILLDTLCILQDQKHELGEIILELVETIDKLVKK